MKRSSVTFAHALGTAALTLSLALVGCGQAAPEAAPEEAAQEEATEEQAAPEEETQEAATEISVPEEATAQTDVVRAIAEEGNAADAGDLTDLGTLEDEQLDTVEKGGDITTGLDDASKTPSDTTLLMDGGIQMQIPKSWFISQDDDGFVIQSSDGTITGYMYSIAKPAGASYDLEAMCKRIPYDMMDMGYTNIEIVSRNSYYSSTGKLVDSYILYAASLRGTDYMFYTEFVESKSFLNCVEFAGTREAFYNNIDAISGATNSVAFNQGEAI